MICNKCSNKMTLLFTSFVCDFCNPPKSKTVDTNNNFKYYFRWPEEDENGLPGCALFDDHYQLFDDLTKVKKYSFERVWEIVSKTKLPLNETIVLLFEDNKQIKDYDLCDYDPINLCPDKENLRCFRADIVKEVTRLVKPQKNT